MIPQEQNVLSVVIIIIFLSLLFLPKFWKYFVNGILLTGLGVTALLFEYNRINFNIMEIPALYYVIKIIIFIEGKNLLEEGVKEHKGILQKITISTGVFLISITAIPELYKLGAISFSLPHIPLLISYIIYVFSGIIIIFGSFSISHLKGGGLLKKH